jgi:GNAT superfamily N-acetyltransferase
VPGEALIRAARPADAAALTRLALRSKQVWGYDTAFMGRCRAELTVTLDSLATRPTFLLAEAGRPLGFYQLRLEADVVDVWLFFVAPEAIGQGVGRRLWQHLQKTARDYGAARIMVDADPNAAGFYAAMGAVRCGDRSSASFPGRRLPHFEQRVGTSITGTKTAPQGRRAP